MGRDVCGIYIIRIKLRKYGASLFIFKVEVYYELIREMQGVGITVVEKEDVWDNLMRIKNAEVGDELLEISLGNVHN